jgi:hypothetical protein
MSDPSHWIGTAASGHPNNPLYASQSGAFAISACGCSFVTPIADLNLVSPLMLARWLTPDLDAPAH